MRRVSTLALLALACGCNGPSEAQSVKSVSIIEVPLRTAADHDDLIAIMRRMASANGMHVDDDSQKWADFQRSIPPNEPVVTRATIYVGVWRGLRDDDFEVSVSDMMHQGRAWVTFLHEGRADLPIQRREQVLSEIRRRWPNAQAVPVLPSGGEPLAEDLKLTSQGYKIIESAAARYGLPAASPLVTRD